MQTWTALFILERVLADNRDITRVVELGTGHGALTLFFGLHMAVRSGWVLTFDIKKMMVPEWHRLAERLHITFEQRDVFDPATVQRARDFIKDGRALVFCDNGDKKREFPLYTRILKKNDLIMVHDWGPVDLRSVGWSRDPLGPPLFSGEIRRENLDPVTLSLLDPYRQREFDALKTRILSMKCVTKSPPR